MWCFPFRIANLVLVAMLTSACGGKSVPAGTGGVGTGGVNNQAESNSAETFGAAPIPVLQPSSGAAPIPAPQPSSSDGAASRPGGPVAQLAAVGNGLVVDGRVAYVMSDAGIVAVDLFTGKKLWTREGSEKPVLISKGRLVTVGGSSEHAGLAIVNSRTGRTRAECKRPAPPDAVLRVNQGLGVDYTASGVFIKNKPALIWAVDTHYVGGQPPTGEMLRAAETHRGGTLAINMSTGCTSPMQAARIAVLGALHLEPVVTLEIARIQVAIERTSEESEVVFTVRRTRGGKELSATEVGRGRSGYAFPRLSADERYFVVTHQNQRPASDGSYIYRWRLVNLATGAVHEFEHNAPTAAFIVINQTIVSVAHTRNGSFAEGISIKSGKIKWRQQIRPTYYNGPIPP